jgi:YVTN family beta-propeller protein
MRLSDPATHQIAVMNAGDGTVTLIDPVARKATGTITVGGGLEFGVADGKGGAYVNVEDRNAIAVLDLRARRVTRTIALTGCEGPTGLALVNGGTRLISACANGKAVVADPGTGKVVATLAIGRDPDAVLVDARRQRAFIPWRDGHAQRDRHCRPGPIRVIGTVATQVGARTGALDPRDGRIYLPTATLQAPAPGAKRGLPVPGTFVVLVLAPRV